MRVVQLRRGRIIKFTAIGLFALVVLIVLANQFGPSNFGSEPFASALSGQKQIKPGQSYPDDLPAFRGKGNVGNFEPSIAEKVTKHYLYYNHFDQIIL